MIKAIIAVYFILMPSGQWEFVAIEEAQSLDACRDAAADIGKVYRGLPGNLKVICADDRRIDI